MVEFMVLFAARSWIFRVRSDESSDCCLTMSVRVSVCVIVFVVSTGCVLLFVSSELEWSSVSYSIVGVVSGRFGTWDRLSSEGFVFVEEMLFCVIGSCAVVW